MTQHDTERTRGRQARTAPSRWLRGAPAPTERLPRSADHRERIEEMLAGVTYRGVEVDPLVARSVYDEVEYLTRESGIMFVTKQALADRVNTARARLVARCPRARAGRPVTDERVAAVLAHMERAGWITRARKTCRQQVWTVARLPVSDTAARRSEPEPAVASEVAYKLLATYSTTRFARERVSESLSCSRPRERTRSAPRSEAHLAASRIVDRFKPYLRCKGVPDERAAGAWHRFLVSGLKHYRPEDQPAEVAWYERRIAALVEHGGGTAWLSGRALDRGERLDRTNNPR